MLSQPCSYECVLCGGLARTTAGEPKPSLFAYLTTVYQSLIHMNAYDFVDTYNMQEKCVVVTAGRMHVSEKRSVAVLFFLG